MKHQQLIISMVYKKAGIQPFNKLYLEKNVYEMKIFEYYDIQMIIKNIQIDSNFCDGKYFQ
jgi:hypothetical protein